MSHKIIWLEKVNSTNTYLKNLVESESNIDSWTVAATGNQTSGRGRKDRSWVTGNNQNLAFSLLYSGNTTPENTPSLTLVAGIAVSEALDSFGIQSGLKWPNDILVDAKKICGILCETVNSRNTKQFCIIGIGINVNMNKDVADKIDKPATSLYIETSQSISIETILEKTLTSLRKWFELWENAGVEGIVNVWESKCVHLNKKIRIIEDGKVVNSGTFAGLGSHGQVLLKKEDGQTLDIWTGDVVFSK